MKIKILFLMFIVTVNAYTIDYSIDMNTGYYNTYQNNFKTIYHDIFYEDVNVIHDCNPRINDLLESMIKETETIQDEYFNYYETFLLCKEKIDNNELQIKSFSSDSIIREVYFITPDENEKFEIPTILIDEEYMFGNNVSFFTSSFARELKAANDFFNRVDNNAYTVWDEFENVMYILDKLYFQARFIEDFFLVRRFKPTQYEFFMAQNYNNEYLRSMLFYYYGIDRNTLIHGYSLLDRVKNNQITSKDFIAELQNMSQSEYFDQVFKIVDENDYHKLSVQFTYSSMFVYMLNHYKVKQFISDDDIKQFNELIRLTSILLERNLILIEEFQSFIIGYQHNYSILNPGNPNT